MNALLTLSGLVDDFGNHILACELEFDSYISRYYYFNGYL